MKQKISVETLSDIIINGIQEKKGIDITKLDLRKVPGAITDFFIICTGNSNTQVGAIADSVVEEVLKSTEELPWHKEGLTNREWVLLDYVNIVVHIFVKDKREFYDLESLWGDAEFSYYEDTLIPSKVPFQ